VADRPPRTIRFIRAELERPDAERCRAVVQVERPESGLHSGTADGAGSDADGFRAVARAAADAVSEAFADEAVRVRVRGGGDQPTRAAALAVLNATNRFLGSG
jgi:hypothetical protein